MSTTLGYIAVEGAAGKILTTGDKDEALSQLLVADEKCPDATTASLHRIHVCLNQHQPQKNPLHE